MRVFLLRLQLFADQVAKERAASRSAATVTSAMRAPFVTNAFVFPAANTAVVTSRGSATVMRDGEECSATVTSTSAQTTHLAVTAALASIQATVRTPVNAQLVSGAKTANK